MGTEAKAYVTLIILSLLAGIDGLSQDFAFRFRHLTIEDGLSNSIIHDIARDSLGFMWFASAEGLHRYDGYEIEVFKNDPADSRSIAHDRVNELFIDRYQRIWLTYENPGVTYFDYQIGYFKNFIPIDGEEKLLNEAFANCVFEDSGGMIWIGTDQGPCFFDEKEKRVQRIDSMFGRSAATSFPVKNIAESSDGLIWFTSVVTGQSGKGIYIFDPTTNNFHALNSAINPNLPGDAITCIFEDSRNNIWIGTIAHGALLLESGYQLPSISNWKFERYLDYPNNHPSIKRSDIFSIYETSGNDIWFATNLGLALLREDFIASGDFEFFLDETRSSIGDNPVKKIAEDGFGDIWAIPDAMNIGLFRYNYKENKYCLFKNERYNEYSVSSDKFLDIYIDEQDIIWLASDNSGIDILDLHQKRFTTYRSGLGDESTLSSNKLFGMDEDQDGHIWIASFNGLNKYDPRLKTFQYFNNSWKPGFFNQNEMFEVFNDHQNKLWIGYLRVLMSRFDPVRQTNKRFIGSEDDSTSFLGWSVRDIIEDRQNNLWIGTKGSGLWKYNRENDIFSVYLPDSSGNSISGNEIFDLYEAPDGTLWIATNSSGLNRYDPETNQFRVYVNKPGDTTSLQCDQLLCIAPGDSGILWLGTVNKGLVKFNIQDELFYNYSEEDGLCDNMVKGILTDEDGTLWISTNNGLSNFDPSLQTFTNYTREDGIQGNEFNILSYFKSSEGTMYFGGTNGLTVFHPSEIKRSPHHVNPVIYELKINNRRVLPGKVLNHQVVLDKSIEYTDHLHLNHKNKVLSLSFSALNYASPEKTRYQYKLEGYDQSWIVNRSDNRVVTYTNLDPGEYLFKLKATNSDGILSETTRALRITILPRWWQTRMFRIILTIITALLVLTWIQIRKSQRRAQKNKILLGKGNEPDQKKQLYGVRDSEDLSGVTGSHSGKKTDDLFIQQIESFIQSNIQDNELNAKRIADELQVSRSFVYQKIKAYSGQTVNEFIRTIRLNTACELMKDKGLSLSEIAYSSGFTSLNYFSRSFKKQFNQLPSEFRKKFFTK